MSALEFMSLELFYELQRQQVNGRSAHERDFVEKVRNYHRIVSTFYYDKKVEQLVRQVVPWKELTIASVTKLLQLKREQPDIKIGSEDLLLFDLVSWFKNEFFRYLFPVVATGT